MQLGKQQQGLILAKSGAVWYFWSGTVALFLSVLRQNYEVPLLCLTVLWSQSNLICSGYSVRFFMHKGTPWPSSECQASF